jgi:putative intracellular protease/amidase
MKKILVVLTNTDHFEKNGEKTGLWLAEACEFVLPVEKAGYKIDYVSPLGGKVPIDPRSLKPLYVSKEVRGLSENPDFQRRALSETLSPAEVRPEDYEAVYYTGGHGVVFDFPEQEELQKISREIYEAGGFVCSVCHGIAGLLNIKTTDGSFLISGKRSRDLPIRRSF